MGRHSNIQALELRAAVQAAVDDDIITPTEVLEYLEDNGFSPMPTRPTVISILNDCGIIWVAGGWMNTKQVWEDSK